MEEFYFKESCRLKAFFTFFKLYKRYQMAQRIILVNDFLKKQYQPISNNNTPSSTFETIKRVSTIDIE